MKSTRILGALVAIAFTATACGGASDTETAGSVNSPTVESEPTDDAADSQPEPSGDAAEGDQSAAAGDESAVESGENELPNVDVIDLATGDTISLASFAPGEKPIVLWFWAPF